jgi:trehalose-phosphatase
MKRLYTGLNKLKNKLQDRGIFLFLDYDGTLTPKVGDPDKAVIHLKTKSLIKRISQNKNCMTAIVTGRSLRDIRKRVGLKNIVYAANHGLQIRGPKIKLNVAVPTKYKIALQHIKRELSKRFAQVKGVFLEDKELSISYHYGLVSGEKVHFIKDSFYQVTAPYCKSGQIKIEAGKKLLEVRPNVKWDKGQAVLWLLQRLSKPTGNSYLPIYIGDDSTDEDAFKALKNKGLTVIVGRNKKSHAQYYIRNTRETIGFINWILKVC